MPQLAADGQGAFAGPWQVTMEKLRSGIRRRPRRFGEMLSIGAVQMEVRVAQSVIAVSHLRPLW